MRVETGPHLHDEAREPKRTILPPARPDCASPNRVSRDEVVSEKGREMDATYAYHSVQKLIIQESAV